MKIGHSPDWMAGDTVVFRGVWRKKIWYAMPATVVQNTPDLTAFYWRAGTPNKIPHQRLSPSEMVSLDKPTLIDSKWIDTDVLMLVPPGAAHAVYAMWETGHITFECWYINLQEPLQRTTLGFDAMDRELDIVVSPDMSRWRWKDEDEFAEAVRVGMYTSQQARQIREEGERALNMLLSDRRSFYEGWKNWRPPSDWKIPEFPPNWDEIDTSVG